MSEELVCFFCNAVIAVPETGMEAQCPQCGRWQDLRAQFAYVRGVGAFEDAIAEMHSLESFRKRKDKPPTFRIEYIEREKQMDILFAEAYSSLLEAFEHDLPDLQHERALEMMIHIARLFLPKNMISSLEASYWNSLMVFQTTINEQSDLREKLQRRGFGASIWRWRWKMRYNQLDRALLSIDQRIRLMENNLSSAHPLRAYRGLKE
jgi:hypothetical protein